MDDASLRVAASGRAADAHDAGFGLLEWPLVSFEA